MPLPPALAARLAKRGLLKSSVDSEPVEEVIAEDYDDHFETHPVVNTAAGGKSLSKTDRTAASDPAVINSADIDHLDELDELVHEVPLCPNRFNPYHLCVEYCQHRWGFKRFRPDPSLASRHDRLLKRYPAPPNWLEVGDPETGRYYYWNTDTDEVSWLPPQHPRALIVASIDKQEELAANDNQWDSQGESESEESTDLDDEIDDDRDLEEIEQDLKRKAQSARDRGKDHRSRRKHDDSLDPMDPAAYSDVPRGGWSSGLELRDTAKTGADVTAAGPLFQQRPYPSPGAVLRMNKTDNSGSGKK